MEYIYRADFSSDAPPRLFLIQRLCERAIEAVLKGKEYAYIMPAQPLITIRQVLPPDKVWVRDFIVSQYKAETVVVHNTIYKPHELHGFIASVESKRVGLITFRIDAGACEIVTINSLKENIGVGSMLLDAVKKTAAEHKCHKIWLITTNDNCYALRFFQKRGFSIAAFYKNAVEKSRKIKPEIPATGFDGIPIKDEIELEMSLR